MAEAEHAAKMKMYKLKKDILSLKSGSWRNPCPTRKSIDLAQVLEYGDNCQYTYTKMKTEPQDQSYPHVHAPDYHVPRSHQQLSINTADIPGGSGLSAESTYDALYRQASRSEFSQGQSFDTRRKARTYHRLLATPSRDDPEDSTSTMG